VKEAEVAPVMMVQPEGSEVEVVVSGAEQEYHW